MSTKIDTIDRIMSEKYQGCFRTGLQAAVEVLYEFLPPDSIDEIAIKLRQLRGKYEGFDVPRKDRNEVAGLVVGMVDYCLFDIHHPWNGEES